jgi:hypothetical protein
MGSGVFMAKDDDSVEVNGPHDVPPEEEEDDEELEPVSDEHGGRSSTLTPRTMLRVVID